MFESYTGVGTSFDLSQPFLLVSQHSVTTEYGKSRNQIEETLEALAELKIPTIMLWPNADAGGNDISKGIRTFREKNNPSWLYLFKNLPSKIYVHLMNTTSCLVGNSSSGLREGAFIGTPEVNIGTRQNKRLRAKNVTQVDHNSHQIIDAIRKLAWTENIIVEGAAALAFAAFTILIVALGDAPKSIIFSNSFKPLFLGSRVAEIRCKTYSSILWST